MSDRKLARSAGGALAVAGVAALLTGGIALAQGGHHQAGSAVAGSRSVSAKQAPPGSGPVSVTGHTVHVIPAGGRSRGSGEAKQAPPGSGPVSVTGHTVHVIPSGTPSRGSL